MMYLMVAGGLVLLLVGGDVLVRGAVAMAQQLGVPPLVIGLTVVAFGTSAPELVVSVEAVLSGVPKLAIGNVVGSNVANVLLVLGVPALIFPIVCDAAGVRRDGAIMVALSLGFAFSCFLGVVGRLHGAVMLAILIGFLLWSYLRSRAGDSETEEAIVGEIDEIASKPQSVWVSLLYVAAGLAGLVGGSSLLVEGAVAIARGAGLSEEIIGLTLVALGTSLPELATSLIAALRRHGDVAVGNVIGSNLFNMLGIMGIAAMVRPVPVPAQFLVFDLWVMVGASAVLLFLAVKSHQIGRLAGAIMTLAYVAYIVILFNEVGGMTVQAGA